jgi:hypothetical protein
MVEESSLFSKLPFYSASSKKLEDLINILREKGVLTEKDIEVLKLKEQARKEEFSKALRRLLRSSQRSKQQKVCPICGKLFRGSQALGSHLWYMHKQKRVKP